MGVKYNGRTVSILISHLGIDSDFFHTRSESTEVLKAVDALREKHKGRTIVCTMDSLDMVKASMLKFEMWELLLKEYPEWKDKIVLVGSISPDSDPNNQAFVRETISKQIQRIKDKFGSEVIDVSEGSVSLDEQIALYRASQIGLVTTFWDGLNVLPFEYTATQDPENPGVLIVSDFMGCSRSLAGVLRVNPWNLGQVASAVNQALSLTPAERSGMFNLRREYVMQHNAVFWAKGFLRNLDEAARLVVDVSFVQVGFGSSARLVGLKSNFKHLRDHDLIMAYKKCGHRVFFIDYDGTLTAPTDRGFNGAPEEVKNMLEMLCSDPQNTVFIMSGRRRRWLQEQLGYIERLGLAAEKGGFIRWPVHMQNCRKDFSKRTTDTEMDRLWENLSPVDGGSWKKEAMEVLEQYTLHTDGSYVEDKDVAIVWHYENADPEFGLLQATELQKFLAKVLDPKVIEVVLYDYSRIVEIKPQGVDKGSSALHILKQLNSSSSRSPRVSDKKNRFILAIGDDRSDENMFVALHKFGQTADSKTEALDELRQAKRMSKKKLKYQRKMAKGDPNTFTCCVGMKPSQAKFYMQDHDDVVETLTELAQVSAIERKAMEGGEDVLPPLLSSSSTHKSASRPMGGRGGEVRGGLRPRTGGGSGGFVARTGILQHGAHEIEDL